MYQDYGLYINGEWRPAASGDTYAPINPATEETLGEAPSAAETDVRAAIAAAERGFEVWRKTEPWERARIIRRIGDLMGERIEDLAKWLTLELGKPLAQSRGELGLSIDQFHWFAEEAKRVYGQTVEARTADERLIVTYQPVGVVAAFTAWNFPVVLMARKIAPALAAGCSIICRPSIEAPGSAMALIQCCHDAGVPPGVVNLLTGRASAISPTLMESQAVRKVSLTGSVEVGKQLLREAADTVKRVSMELGGHAPVIVFDDTDADKVAELSAVSKFRHCGQVCVSPSRFYVHESKVDQFTKRFVEIAEALKIGDGMEPDTELGPMTTKDRLEAIEELVEASVKEGAKLLTGGKRPAGFNRGYFYEPTVFSEVRDSARIMTEEPFGPIAPITAFKDFDEVMERANSLRLGLASYVFTGSLKRAHAASAAMEAGMVAVNTYAMATAEAPFGGIKDSGMGREGGSIGIKDYLDAKYTRMALG